MGEEAGNEIFQGMKLKKRGSYEAWCSGVMMMEEGNNNEICDDDSVSMESSIEEDSENSISSTSPSDLVDDASSSAIPSSLNGPFELIGCSSGRGLSEHYQGKSRSFTSLASVRGIDDLLKKVINTSYNRAKTKSCKSYGWGLDNKSCSPKAKISKKTGAGKRASSRGCFMASVGSLRDELLTTKLIAKAVLAAAAAAARY